MEKKKINHSICDGDFMENKLKQLLKTQELCSVYSNVLDTDRFAVGYIVGLDDEWFMMESIDEYGKRDGLFCGLLENIIKIETNSKYNQNINKLFNYFETKRYPDLKVSGRVLDFILNYISINSKVCSIELCDSNNNDAVGKIVNINSACTVISIEIIDSNGEKDGIVSVATCNISHVGCDSMEENKLEILQKLL